MMSDSNPTAAAASDAPPAAEAAPSAPAVSAAAPGEAPVSAASPSASSSAPTRPPGAGPRPGGDRRPPPRGGDRGGDRGGGGRRFFRRKKVDFFSVNKIDDIDYKAVDALKQFIGDRGKILPRRHTGLSAHHQRRLKIAIMRARNIAMLPFAGEY